MNKKTVNSDIYNLSKLVDDVKSAFIPDETEETLAIGTYGYIGALESNRLQTQVQMTGELCNEVFPSRARLDRNVITHAIMANIEDINAHPAKMSAFLALKEKDISENFDSDNLFIIDRECPIYVGDYEFHLEYDIKIKRILNTEKSKKDDSGIISPYYNYTAQYIIPDNREVPTSSITSASQYLNPPAVVLVGPDKYLYLTISLSQVEHHSETKKLVTANIIDNKIINFEFDNQLAYFEIHCSESDQDYYITPVFEGSSIPKSKSQYYCWYQYIDTNLIRVRFDRSSYMPGLNSTIECLVKTCQGSKGNFTFKEDTYITLESEKYGYKGITCLLSPLSDSTGGRDRKSKKELQALIPKESLSRGSLTTISDLNNYFGMLDSDNGRVIIQKKVDNQIERVYYAYFVAKDLNNNVIPSNTIDIYVDKDELISSKMPESQSSQYILPSGSCFKLDEDGIGRINHDPIIESGYQFAPKAVSRGYLVKDEFEVEVTSDKYDAVSCVVDVNGSLTPTLVFPKEDDKKYQYTNTSKVYEVEDYLQFGAGNEYTYIAEYITKEDNAIINVRDKYLECFKYIEGFYYTSDPNNKHYFNSLPIIAHNIPKNTKITFGITNLLMGNYKGITYIQGNNKVYKMHQKNNTKLSSILNNLGYTGEVKDAISLNPDIISLTEIGEIIKTDNISKVALKSSKSLDLYQNKSLLNNPYKLTVVKEQDLPSIKDRLDNEWFYVIESSKDRREGDGDNIGRTGVADEYNVHVFDEESKPPIEDRIQDNWYYIIERSSEIKEEEDPDQPDVPGDITGKEYKIDILKAIQENEDIKIKVTIDETSYILTLSQDRNIIENTMYIYENSILVSSNLYTDYLPVLDQNPWPEKLNIGDKIRYTLTYKSISNAYTPKISIKLSRGLKYTLFSNTIIYPDGSSVQYEPTDIPISTGEIGFLYANPYAININPYHLYSAFYMMAMDENPFVHFDYINDKSNVQFIATNAYWNRPFIGDNKNKYSLSFSITQSVQDDLGIGTSANENPLIKAVVVFKRNGSYYRYRSMQLSNYDPSSFTFLFNQNIISEDIFDNENNIKCTNLQVAGQKEFTITLSYEDKEYILNNGDSVNISELISLFELTGSIKKVQSYNSSSIAVNPITNKDKKIIDYKLTALLDSANFQIDITISSINPDSGKEEENIYTINCVSTSPAITEYGYLNPVSEAKIYILCALPDNDGNYSRYDFDSICPGLEKWTVTNVYDIVNGITLYHNYSEIMSSRITPDGPRAVSFKCNNNTKLLNMGESIKAYDLLDSLGINNMQITEITSSDEQIISISAVYEESIIIDYDISILTDFKSKESINVELIDSDGHSYQYSISVSARDDYGNVIMNGSGFYISSVPMFGYDYCQNEELVQNAINALNYRKAYMNSVAEKLENSFGIDFKLFNTYGPSKTFYIIDDANNNSILDDTKKYIDRVNLTFYFRTKLTTNNDSYTKDNIIKDVKEYIEDLDELGELHIPNLVSTITSKYSEQIIYFEYLGFNEYGANIQHLYKENDSDINIHTAPEFLNINNVIDTDNLTKPDINIYVSEI